MDNLLQIIVPAFNEETVIYDNLVSINNEVSLWCDNAKIIVVNDGSKDNTLQECYKAQQFLNNLTVITYGENQGKGAALKAGVAAAEAAGYIVFIDADLDISPDQIKNLYDTIINTESDSVIGSKLHRESEVEYPISRRIVSFLYYLVVRVLFGLKVHDTQTGLKIFDAKLLKPVTDVILVKKFAYDIEILSILNHRGAKIIEAPVKIVFSRSSPFGRIKAKDILSTAIDTTAVFYRLKIIRYYDRKLQ